MADGAFPPPDPQSEYAFPSGQSEGQDEAGMVAQRNEQIQQGFDQSRMQRSMMQGIGSQVGKQAQQISELRQRLAARENSKS